MVRTLLDAESDDLPHPVRVLDYGCGKGGLKSALAWDIAEYDPGIPGKDAPPEPADLVVCTDVLEHVEPDRLGRVLTDLRRVTRRLGYFTIHTDAARNVLPDGRNAHLIQRDRIWWGDLLGEFFRVRTAWLGGLIFHAIVEPLP